ncbi:hypothetical protein LPIBR_50036 [Lacticaseibacillus paracasei]|nr:hypothetical protein LPIBR_50036 [Lacticaseibacillus paracasei]
MKCFVSKLNGTRNPLKGTQERKERYKSKKLSQIYSQIYTQLEKETRLIAYQISLVES